MSNDEMRGQKDPERPSGVESYVSAHRLWIADRDKVDEWIAMRPRHCVDLEANR
jgi:hypothetical protein